MQLQAKVKVWLPVGFASACIVKDVNSNSD